MIKPGAVVIMAKHPRHSNSRLGRALAEDERAALSERMISATVRKLRAVEGADTYLSYAPGGAGEYFGRFGLRTFEQQGADIGQRMHFVLGWALGLGHRKAVCVGVDIPGLGAGIVGRALGLLDSSDVVFGPAEDGGYYLVGLKSPQAGLFEGVVWSSSKTLAQSIERAGALGLKTSFVDTLFDIDRPEDIARLKRHEC